MQQSPLPALPALESSLVKEIPVHVQQRLRFDWSQIEQSALHGSLALCHAFSRNFLALVRSYGVDVDAEIMRWFCVKCECVLLPTVTAKVRVNHSSRSAGKKRPRCKNFVAVTCNMCNQTNRAEGTRRWKRQTMPAKQQKVVIPVEAPEQPKKPFSFAGNFIPLGPKPPEQPAKSKGFATLDDLERAKKKKRKQNTESLTGVKQLFQPK